MGYEILDHRADLKIKFFGKTKEELFKNAIRGMFKGAKYEAGEEKIKREIKIFSSDASLLLVDFLSEALYLSEINKEIYQDIEFNKFAEKEIEGILIGKKIKKIGIQIKGVTYHDLNVRQKEDGNWEAIVLFDI